MFPEMVANGGTAAFETAQSVHFIRNEGEVDRPRAEEIKGNSYRRVLEMPSASQVSAQAFLALKGDGLTFHRLPPLPLMR